MNNDEKIIKFKGKVIREVYKTNDFAIYAMDVSKEKYPYVKHNLFKDVSICGDLPNLVIGMEYEVSGTESETKKYGYQYRVKHIKQVMPSSKQDMETFLAEILSPTQFEEIWREYPDICDLIKQHRLNEIDLTRLKGIGQTTLDKIVKRISENIYLADLVSEFKGYLSMAVLKKIYDKYNSIEKLREKLKQNPYKCLCDISGIGFKTADSILLEIEKVSKENVATGGEPIIDFDGDLASSPERCLECVKYLLKENENDGHTKIDLVQLRNDTMKLVPKCGNWFTTIAKSEEIYYNKSTLSATLRKTYEKEKYIADSIKNNILYKIGDDNIWKFDIEKYRDIGEFGLTDEQMQALDNLCKYKISMLTAPAGAGKTASTKAIINMLDGNNKTYMLMSPTGKAAKIISDYTNREATTIHRGLKFNPKQKYPWTYNKGNKLQADVIILDEFSMVGISLFVKLIDAIDFEKTKLMLIGDDSQLCSVGCGNLLHDFIQSKIIPTTFLTKIFRYGEGGLMKIATDVRNGIPYLNSKHKNKCTIFGQNKDYAFIDVPDDKITEKMIAVYKALLNNGAKVNEICVLSFKNIGNLGTISLNNTVQKIANPNYGSAKCVKYGDTVYYVGDMVIQTKNNYQAKRYTENGKNDNAFIANGETGVIVDIIDDNMIICFDSTTVEYSRGDYKTISLGYCISLHKSQGGQFNYIILISPKGHSFFTSSNLLYVGLTRMKQKCYHIGNVQTINRGVKKKEDMQRNTFMQEFLLSQ